MFGINVSSYSETKFVFFTNNAVVVTSLVRSHVVVKLLNYVTDKIVSKLYVRASVREREREKYSMHIIKRHFFVAKTCT